MIYIDTSVALSQLFVEDRKPPLSMWSQPLIASRLLRVRNMDAIEHARPEQFLSRMGSQLIEGVALAELAPPILERALERTLPNTRSDA
ncbi:MAG: hypothetical protein OXF20_04155 [Gammaproteobacteria bacterium]|nr:hypothetical protein [Gammaproteobacteria bacterium]